MRRIVIFWSNTLLHNAKFYSRSGFAGNRHCQQIMPISAIFTEQLPIFLNELWQHTSITKECCPLTKFNKCAAVNPFAPGHFAEKRVLKLVEWFSGHCRAIKS